jgi:uroporphyrin-3 C-methyltransferase
MTDAEKKSATTDEAEVKKTRKKSAQKKATVPESTLANQSKPQTSSNTGIFILIFFVAIATLGGLYQLWESQQLNLIKQQAIRQEITTLKQQQSKASTQNEEQIKKIHTEQGNLRLNLTNLVRNSEHLRNDWLMAEAEYLIQLANHRLLLEKDVATAIVALKAADARLAEVADPALLYIRKILAKDLLTLNNITTVDLAGLSITLSALSNNIPNLPLSTPDPKTHKLNQTEKKPASSNIENIQELPSAIWQDIKSLIVIRNHEKPLQPLLAPNQHFFLLQNLALLLEQSRLALLNGHNEIFQERLNTTKKWINQFFDTEHNVTRNMLASIDELQKIDIDPTLPDISSTFSAVKKYRTQGQLPKKSVAKVKEKS